MKHKFIPNGPDYSGMSQSMQVCSCGYEMPWFDLVFPPNVGGYVTISPMNGDKNVRDMLLNKLIGFTDHLGELLEGTRTRD